MQSRLIRALAAPMVAAALGAAAPAHAIDYTLTDLGLLSSSYSYVYATGINASGQVVGYGYNDGQFGTSFSDSYQAFVTGANGAGMRAIPTLGGSWNKANAINDKGWVVGTSATTTSTPGGDTRGFIDKGPGTTRSLGTLAGPSTATAINNNGRVVGSYTAPGDHQRGYYVNARYNNTGGTMHDIGSLGGPNTRPTGVSASGQVVGESEIYPSPDPYQSYHRAFVTSTHDGDNPRIMAQVAQIGADPTSLGHVSSAAAINDLGQIVGTTQNAYYTDASPFIAGPDGIGRRLDLHDMGEFPMAGAWQLSGKGLALNHFGQVAGSYFYTVNMMEHAFVSGANGYGLVDVNTMSFTNMANSVRDWIFFNATGINDLGQFVANGSNGHAYLITPVPEPAVVVMMLCGLAWLLWRRGVRRG